MSDPSLICPLCGEAEQLRGTNDGGQITITCESCGCQWLRDPDVCPKCGNRSMTDRREPLMQKARGTQQSIVGFRIVHECSGCGYEAR